MTMNPHEYDTPDLIGTIRSLEVMLNRYRDDPKWTEWCEKSAVEIDRLSQEYKRRQVH